MTEVKHTPTPWKSIDERILTDKGYLIAATDISDMSWQEDEYNAAHIVKCVNLHDELVAALKAAKGRLHWASSTHADKGKAQLLGHWSSSVDEVLKKTGAL